MHGPRAIRLWPRSDERVLRRPPVAAGESNGMQLARRKLAAPAELDRGGIGAGAATRRYESHPAARTGRTDLARRARFSDKIFKNCLLGPRPDHPGWAGPPGRAGPVQAKKY